MRRELFLLTIGAVGAVDVYVSAHTVHVAHTRQRRTVSEFIRCTGLRTGATSAAHFFRGTLVPYVCIIETHDLFKRVLFPTLGFVLLGFLHEIIVVLDFVIHYALAVFHDL